MAEISAAAVPVLQRSYAEDYAGWIEDTARAIEEGRFSEMTVPRSPMRSGTWVNRNGGN